MEQSLNYTIKLPQFEGPFDLLLFFIERDELDIYDIPISKLTQDFLDYIHQMELLNIELASEFMLVAATLMRIKAKMLLPRKELNEDGEEIDPREELVQKLLEYKRFKEVVNDLQTLEENREKQHLRGNVIDEMNHVASKYQTEAELESLSLYRLMQVFQKVMNRFEDRKKDLQLEVVRYPYTIKTERSTIKEILTIAGEMTPFEDIFANCQNRVQAIHRFLAILEMLQERLLKLRQGIGFNNFWLDIRQDENN